MSRLKYAIGALGAFLWVTGAWAVTLTDTSGPGGTYTLVLDSAVNGHYEFLYTIDAKTLTLPENQNIYLNNIDIKVLAGDGYSNVTVTPSGWLADAGPLMGTGCQGQDTSGHLCFTGDPKILVDPSNAPYAALDGDGTITFRIGFDTKDALLAEAGWHLGARYSSDGKANGWVVSLPAPPVPEPASAAVFGLGALIVGAVLRRRRS